MRRILCGVGAAVALGALAAPALAAPDRVTICHATGSSTNPFVVIQPAAAGVARGHLDHHDGADGVPAFTYRGVRYGQDGAGPLAGCQAAPEEPGDGGDGDGGGWDGGSF